MSKILKYMTVTKSSTIKNAMININKNKTGSVFITKNKTILGIVTDGDIRRYLINNKKLDAKIENLMNKKFVSIDSFETRGKYFQDY